MITQQKKNSLLCIRRSKFRNRDWFAQIDTSFCFVKYISCFAKLVTWPISPKQASFSFQSKMTSLVSGICKSKLKKHRVPDLINIFFPAVSSVNFVAEARFFRGLHFSLDKTVYHYSWKLREYVHLRYWRPLPWNISTSNQSQGRFPTNHKASLKDSELIRSQSLIL